MVTLLVVHVVATVVLAVVLVVVIAMQAAARALRSASVPRPRAASPARLHVAPSALPEDDDLLRTRELQPR